MTEVSPVSLAKTENRELTIEWSNGETQVVSFRTLRDNCRCAHCIDKRMEPLKTDEAGKPKLSNSLPILSLAETMPLDIVQMHPVGNYAYNIHFSDGHSAGIYPFEFLRSLGQSAQ